MNRAGRLLAAAAMAASATLVFGGSAAYAGTDGPQVESPDKGASVWFEQRGDKLHIFDQLEDGRAAVGLWKAQHPKDPNMRVLCDPVWNTKGQGYQVDAKCHYDGKYREFPEGWRVEYYSCTGNAADRTIGTCTMSNAKS
ncbi:hypothetical protein ACFY12_12570 [Streptomyces sp. NPDC001339]|uniref:hypothetical protein n=1 Tax=Streptomyces sp. NPDC001339 TaxID=3364563 RepID=UPI0036B37216